MTRHAWSGAGLTIALIAAGAGAGAQDQITLSAAYTPEDMAAHPTTRWITNGGNLANQRYSPLDEIDRGNVAGLKAHWRASLNGSGVIPRGSNQGEPIYHDGVLYVTTSENDVFAVDVDTGELLWDYAAELNPERVAACCGWAVRGLAIGEGKVFIGRLDAVLVALDQETGEVAWDVQIADPGEFYSITSAPRYFDGMVFTGTSGGVMGTRGRMQAYDAATGELIWTFYTVPAPGELGHDTWPQDSDVWKYGGAAVWQTPSIDPELGMMYFGTSNPGPVGNGALRQGDNLFSSSVVAIDVHTGEYRWHFQEVHHDIWDYDASNPTVLFDVEIPDENGRGVMRKGIAQAGKTGWVYLLDRTNGEPLVGIEELPVPQEPRQHTSPTQPYPIGDALVPQFIDIPPEGYDLVNEGRIFTPFWQDPVLWKPFAAMNHPPSSYDPEAGLLFVCATDGFWGAANVDPDFPIEPTGVYSGNDVLRVQGPRRGTFGAIDVRTNRLAWHQQWVDGCYSGSLATAGGLVFIGRSDGRITAVDSATGRRLWQFQTDGGVNAPPITFERDGVQYLAVYAGGTALSASRKSDGLWLFSLNGTMISLAPGSADPAGQFAQAAPVTPPPGRTADLAQGREIYTRTCGICHGETGRGGPMGGAPLTAALTIESIMTTATNGRNTMPAFSTMFSREELHDVASYVRQELVEE
jgi:alcohol dehydrogenase (cytochrome c)